MNTEYKRPETAMELVQRASKTIISPVLFKKLMANKAKSINSTKTNEIIDALVDEYMETAMHGIKKDYSPSDFALWANNMITKLK